MVMKQKSNLTTHNYPNPIDKSKDALVRNRLYKYFLAEFSSILRKDKNEKMRNELKKIILNTKFNITESLTQLRIKLVNFFKNYPFDLNIIKELITRAFILSPNNPSDLILKSINFTFFDFDKQLLLKLKKMEIPILINELKKIMTPYISISDIKIESTNLYISCNEKSSINTKHCINKKLIIPEDIIEDYYHILAMDIKNPTKSYLLTAISAGAFDSMDFIKHKNEILDIFIEN